MGGRSSKKHIRVAHCAHCLDAANVIPSSSGTVNELAETQNGRSKRLN
uniref:Uncharacterized protein n=1 Tax=Melanopsichium pennsylvanicum 4 TaxID=1398559 RepID=A0A077RCA6_9BASI|nr:uncharacterized protein BN887_06185 [Melanopsichium pennsylvanicum 4]